MRSPRPLSWPPVVSCPGLKRLCAAAASLPGSPQQPLLFSAESLLLPSVSSAGTVIGKCLETPLALISKESGKGNSFASPCPERMWKAGKT